jgi:uncharacterized protein (DUF58 family)
MMLAPRLRWSRWLFRTPGVESGPVTLTQRRIYILPSRAGLLFAATLLVMLVGCVNYNLSLGYVLTFLLAGSGMVSILHTFRNLARMQLASGRAQPVFVGQDAGFPVHLINRTRLQRCSVALHRPHSRTVYTDVAPESTATAEIRAPALRRGKLALGRIRVFTTFPLGLFYAWSNVELDADCVVYPRPEAGNVPLPQPALGARAGVESGAGQDDFAGLRKYQPGDSLRHVAWKAVARGQPILTKQFSGLAEGELWLEWDSLPSEFGVEARLSRLARWIVDASRAGNVFGLQLPERRIPPGSGAAHEEQCLTALALFRNGG